LYFAASLGPESVVNTREELPCMWMSVNGVSLGGGFISELGEMGLNEAKEAQTVGNAFLMESMRAPDWGETGSEMPV